MGTRVGTLLERNIESIFKLAGFRTKHQTRIKGYEIDVLAKYHGFTILIECKQYEKSRIEIRNLIHQWDSKNKRIGADRVLIVIFGMPISEKYIRLAKKCNIFLWGNKEIEKFYKMVTKDSINAREKILKSLNIISLPETKHKIKKEKEVKELDYGEEPITDFVRVFLNDEEWIEKVRVKQERDIEEEIGQFSKINQKNALTLRKSRVVKKKSFWTGQAYYEKQPAIQIQFGKDKISDLVGIQAKEIGVLHILKNPLPIGIYSPRKQDVGVIAISDKNEVIGKEIIEKSGFLIKHSFKPKFPVKFYLVISKRWLKDVKIRDIVTFIELD